MSASSRPKGAKGTPRPAQSGRSHPRRIEPTTGKASSPSGSRQTPAGQTPGGRTPGRGSSNRAGAPGTGEGAAAPRPGLSPQQLLDIYRPDLSEVLSAGGAPAFRRTQVLEHLLRRPFHPFSDASVLPADMRQRLDEQGSSLLAIAGTRLGSDGTTKILLEAGDGALVEAVLMP